SIVELQGRLRGRLEEAGAQCRGWLLGRGFDQDLLEERRWPLRSDLEAVSASVPIRIARVCGHALVANGAAMRAAGLPAEPSARGIFTEDRVAPPQRAVPAPSPAEWLAAAAWACEALAAAGFTGVHCLIANRDELNALARLRQSLAAPGETGRLPVRIRLQ